MRILILICFLNLFILRLSGQDNVYQRTVLWKSNIKISNSIEELYFVGAYYPDSLTKLPYYQEIIENGSMINVSISDVQTEPFDSIELINIGSKEFIPDSIVLKQIIRPFRKRFELFVSLIPLYYDTLHHKILKIKSFKFTINKKPLSLAKSVTLASSTYAAHSILASGKWYKFKLSQDGVVSKDGIYKLNYTDIKALGFNSPINSKDIWEWWWYACEKCRYASYRRS